MCYNALQGHSPEVLPYDVAHSVAACYRWNTGDVRSCMLCTLQGLAELK